MRTVCWAVPLPLGQQIFRSNDSIPSRRLQNCYPFTDLNGDSALSRVQPQLTLKNDSRSEPKARTFARRVELQGQTSRNPSKSTITKTGTSLTNATPYIGLLLVTIIWGSQHAVIKYTLENTSLTPSSLNLLRFTLSALFFSPFLPLPTSTNIKTYLAGIELGLYGFLGFAMQTIGLLTTSASRSAFLLYLNVKLVPIFALLLYREQSPRRVWLSAAMALLGTTLLANNEIPPSIGDFYSLLAAASSALFILRLGTHAPKYKPTSLTSISLTTTAILSTLWNCFIVTSHTTSNLLLPKTISEYVPVLYLGVVVTAFASWVQVKAQKSVNASTAAVFYALDPVWGAAFAWIGLGESLGGKGWIGAALITLGAAVSARGIGENSKD